jgi:hypothetical protein
MSANIHRSPDIEFDGTVNSGDQSFPVVCDCRIWLPYDASEDAWVEIHVPDSPETPLYLGPGPLTITGQLGKDREIVIAGVWISHGPSRSYPERQARRSELGLSHIDRITERHAFKGDTGAREPGRAESMILELTDCPYLNPATLTETSYTGDVAVKTINRLKVSYPELGVIAFDRHYQTYRRSDIPGLIRTSVLVADIVEPRPGMTLDVEIIESLMEDVCLLASLAARQRVLSLGLRYITSSERFRTWTSPMKRHRPSPRCAVRDGLVEQARFEEYFKVAVEHFCSMSDKERTRVRAAIYPLAPAFDLGAVETQFLAMFSALESLTVVGLSGDRAARETLDKDRWSGVKRLVKNLINDLGPEYTSGDKDALRQKIGELNRPSARSALDLFCTRFNVDTTDLWPIFGTSESPGLADIRNRLAHGETLSPDATGALGVALTHVALLLERCLLSVLGYPVEQSRASPAIARLEIVSDRREVEALRRSLGAERPYDGF